MVILWTPAALSLTAITKHIGADGAVYVMSTLHVMYPGFYNCSLAATGEERHFVVKSEKEELHGAANR